MASKTRLKQNSKDFMVVHPNLVDLRIKSIVFFYTYYEAEKYLRKLMALVSRIGLEETFNCAECYCMHDGNKVIVIDDNGNPIQN